MLQPIATFIVGVAAAVMALLHWSVARGKLRFDLFDKRYKIFEAAKFFILDMAATSGQVSDSRIDDFKIAIKGHEFLFGDEVSNYLSALIKTALDLKHHQDSIRSATNDDVERIKHINSKRDKTAWVSNQIVACPGIFAPYLSFSHIKKRPICG